MKFCWTTIQVRDMDQSLAFYRDVLGLKLNRRVTSGPDIELAFLGEGDTQVELVRNRQNDDVRFTEHISLGFVVDSLDAFTQALTDRGIALHSGPFQPNPSIRFSFILDPNGLKIQLVEHP